MDTEPYKRTARDREGFFWLLGELSLEFSVNKAQDSRETLLVWGTHLKSRKGGQMEQRFGPRPPDKKMPERAVSAPRGHNKIL